MNKEVFLCAEEEYIREPSLMGLSGEAIISQPWLKVFSDVSLLRNCVQKIGASCEVWIIRSESFDAINLAAALKKDNEKHQVYIVDSKASGSLLSRSQIAGVNKVLGQNEFIRRYCDKKQKYLSFMEEDIWEGNQGISAKSSGFNFQEAGTHFQENIALSETSFLPVIKPKGIKEEGNQENEKTQVFKELKVTNAKESLGNKEVKFPSKKNSSLVSEKRNVFVVAGGGGGCGKSTISALLGVQLNQKGLRTIVFDGDLQFGDIHYFYGKKRAFYLEDVIQNPELITRKQIDIDGFPVLVAPPRKLEYSEALTNQFVELVKYASQIFDVVVVNTGAWWTDLNISLFEQATKILFLLDQRPSSLRICKHALDLCYRCAIPRSSFLFLMNKCGRKALFSSVDAEYALQGAQVVAIQDGGREVDELMGCNCLNQLISSKNPLSTSLEKALVHILPELQKYQREDKTRTKVTKRKAKRSFQKKRRMA